MSNERRIKRAMRADSVTTTPIPEGIRYEVIRGECRAKFDLYEDHVHWVSLTSPGNEYWVGAAHDMAQDLFPKLGVEYLVASAGSPEAEQILKAHGQWEDATYRGKPKLRWNVA
jgi:hypothetical protein